MHSRRLSFVGGIIVAIFFALASPVQAATKSVSIEDFQFNPQTITITAGDTITWTNNGNVSHTATDDGLAWDTGTLAPDAAKSIKFLSAGTYTYHCQLHAATMKGTVVVKAASASATPSPTPKGIGGGTATRSSQPVSGISGPTVWILGIGGFFTLSGLLLAKKAQQFS